ncbi:MAG TPA: hypothetical protein VE715_21075 [Blastocatellia bacterium]|nr:hypothetical protein [Blastocatellia bacterium]
MGGLARRLSFGILAFFGFASDFGFAFCFEDFTAGLIRVSAGAFFGADVWTV